MITLDSALNVAMALTVVGLVSACIRLIIGPSRADRVVSLDLITVLLVAIAAQLSLMYEVAAYLDLGLAIALIGFLATVAFARYIETAPHGQTPEDEPTRVTSEPSASARSVENHSASETHR